MYVELPRLKSLIAQELEAYAVSFYTQTVLDLDEVALVQSSFIPVSCHATGPKS